MTGVFVALGEVVSGRASLSSGRSADRAVMEAGKGRVGSAVVLDGFVGVVGERHFDASGGG